MSEMNVICTIEKEGDIIRIKIENVSVILQLVDDKAEGIIVM